MAHRTAFQEDFRKFSSRETKPMKNEVGLGSPSCLEPTPPLPHLLVQPHPETKHHTWLCWGSTLGTQMLEKRFKNTEMKQIFSLIIGRTLRGCLQWLARFLFHWYNWEENGKLILVSASLSHHDLLLVVFYSNMLLKYTFPWKFELYPNFFKKIII